jgi:hypothetical protein
MGPRFLGAMWVVVVVVAFAPGARAQAPVRLEVVGPLPFSVGELEQAIAARVPMTAAPDATLVIVGPADAQSILLRVAGKSRTLALGDRAGDLSPRVVALAIADLATEGIVAERALARPAPEADAERTPPLLSAALDISKGTGPAEPLTYGVSADLTFTPRRLPAWLRLGASLGAWMVPTQRPLRVDRASLAGGAGRLFAGVGGDRLQALVGPFALPYALEGDAGVARNGVLAGGSAMLRFAQPVGGAMRLLATLRIDAFANRFRVSVGDASPSLASPRIAVALAVGLGWDLGL